MEARTSLVLPENAPCRPRQPLGMGRIIDNGGTAFQIVDTCVHPAHQGRGLGKRTMAALTEELERRAPATAYLSLIADGPARFHYEKYDFADTATHDSIGMYRVMDGSQGSIGARAEPKADYRARSPFVRPRRSPGGRMRLRPGCAS